MLIVSLGTITPIWRNQLGEGGPTRSTDAGRLLSAYFLRRDTVCRQGVDGHKLMKKLR